MLQGDKKKKINNTTTRKTNILLKNYILNFLKY